jgi:hypothetical protein
MGLIIYVHVQVYRVYTYVQVRLNFFFVIKFWAVSFLKSW